MKKHLLDKALTAVFDDLLKSPRLGKIISLYKEILSYPEAVAPLRDMVRVSYYMFSKC